ncbi:ribosomal protein L7/L12 [Paenibacillus harenae]|uniref:Large subunit ribosomal protein L7/L12 n=1 Tax=Paenibacillus harenae TaxID=306543 RepID=A0ABT9U3I7_PAEHA|nr:ribosomal protein L7/L12 [Paenibacillus harenae]MDQ0114196.1 large subunit ribosomal protein L7/L12 [Paenibacillus harenae]
MEPVEWIALSALILSLLLLLKVISLQRQLNDIKSDFQWSNRLQEGSRLTKTTPNVPDSSPEMTRISPAANLDERLRALVASGKRIQAIKEFREANGVGLKEAKDYVDNLDRGN